MEINTKWMIDRELTPKEQEILFLTLESAGYWIYHRTRNYQDIEDHPYIGSYLVTSDMQYVICSYKELVPSILVKYEDVMEQLQKEIQWKMKSPTSGQLIDL